MPKFVIKTLEKDPVLLLRLVDEDDGYINLEIEDSSGGVDVLLTFIDNGEVVVNKARLKNFNLKLHVETKD